MAEAAKEKRPLACEIDAARAQLKKRALSEEAKEKGPLEEKQAHEEKPSDAPHAGADDGDASADAPDAGDAEGLGGPAPLGAEQIRVV
eukprot:1626164-Heterocapsa_arctica.AAC.1